MRSGEERKTDFINVVVWRNTAEFVCKYFKKGSLISVEGSIRVESYQDKDGNNRRTFEIQANNVHFAESKKSDSGVAENDNQPKNYEKEGNSLFDDSDVFETIPTDDDMPF